MAETVKAKPKSTPAEAKAPAGSKAKAGAKRTAPAKNAKPAKKAPGKKAPTKKASGGSKRAAPVKKAAPKKAPGKKATSAKKAPAKNAVPATKAATKKAPAKKVTTTSSPKPRAKGRKAPPAEEFILYEKDKANKIATITLDRAEDLNAMTIDGQHRYADLVRYANLDDDVKVLVIRANGPNLGSGADLPELMDIMAGRGDASMHHLVRVPDDVDVEYPRRGSYRYGASNLQHYTDPAAGMRSLQDFKKISILEVRGYCYGWHFYQAADADIVLSSDDALFGHAAFRYAGYAARMWQWCSMMGVRKFMEMVFTGRPFTAREMLDIDFVNAIVPFDELESLTEKYALACSRTRPTDTVFAQKTFFNIYKQHQGEYMGSILSGLLESTTGLLKPDGDSFELTRETLENGITNGVRDNDVNFPPEWRLSHRGRATP